MISCTINENIQSFYKIDFNSLNSSLRIMYEIYVRIPKYFALGAQESSNSFH